LVAQLPNKIRVHPFNPWAIISGGAATEPN
jgi:hypothetical protein